MITPMDIHNKTFSKKLRGYADDEVNSFLAIMNGFIVNIVKWKNRWILLNPDWLIMKRWKQPCLPPW